MADDARISTALPNHPKMLKLERRLGDAGAWALVKLILWVADNKPDGNLGGMTDEDIEIAVRWGGTGGQFVEVLFEVGFLDGKPDSYSIHDWSEHNPWAANRSQRIAIAKSAAAARWKGLRQDAQSMPDECDQHTGSMQDKGKGNAHLSSPLRTAAQVISSQSHPSAPSQEACRLAQVLKDEILRNKPDFRISPSELQRWVHTADRMIRLDKRDPQRIAELIRWAQQDEFWMANVLSMDKLRQKFDQLEMKCAETERRSQGAVPRPERLDGYTPASVSIREAIIRREASR